MRQRANLAGFSRDCADSLCVPARRCLHGHGSTTYHVGIFPGATEAERQRSEGTERERSAERGAVAVRSEAKDGRGGSHLPRRQAGHSEAMVSLFFDFFHPNNPPTTPTTPSIPPPPNIGGWSSCALASCAGIHVRAYMCGHIVRSHRVRTIYRAVRALPRTHARGEGVPRFARVCVSLPTSANLLRVMCTPGHERDLSRAH